MVIASSILAIAMIALVSGLLSGMRLREQNKEKAMARNAAERVLSAMRGMPSIPDAYDRFGGGGVEETFDVYGLAGPGGGEQVGRVIVWRLKNGTVADPDSSYVWTGNDFQMAQDRFGMPFPLTIVGNEGFHGTDYLDTDVPVGVDALDNPTVMPVTVRVRWRSRNGILTEYFSTIIGVR